MASSSSKSSKDWYVSARNALFICVLIPCLLQRLLAADGSGTYNTLYFNQSVTQNYGLVSANKQFSLCFLNSGAYFGICSTLLRYDPVWIGNRDNPGTDNSVGLNLGLDGNLDFSEGSGNRLWYTNVSTASPSRVIAVLENNGNFVLTEKNSSSSHGRVLWQSFDYPSNMLLPGMKIGISLTTGKTRTLTSWKGTDDPTTGSYSFGIDPQDPNQFFVWRGSVPYSRIIFWNGSDFNAILLHDEDGNGIRFNTDPVVVPLRDNVTVVRSSDEVYLTISENASSWPYIDSLGILRTLAVHGSQLLVSSAWAGKLSAQRCSTPGVCGPNSSCNENQDPICKCLPGFQPTYASKWNSGNWQDGCKLQLELHCGDRDGFLTLRRAKLPRRESDDLFYDRNTCSEICNESGCSCRAYVETHRNANNILCHFWYAEEVKNLQEDVEDEELPEETELMLRVPSSVLSQEGRRCGTCGSSIIPYPLSTGPGCGDQDYSGFHCNTSTSLLYFQTPDGSSYAISRINPETRTFVIKSRGVDLCWAGSAKRMDIQLNSSQPFHFTKNNTVLLLNCSLAMKNLSHLNCSSSSPCHQYIHEGKAPCFHSKMCCSYNAGGFGSTTSHKIGVLDSHCVSYASIVNLNSSTVAIKWHEGVEIEWAAPPEPVCVSDKDCFTWPNSTCSRINIKGVERKRCLCNKKFQWDSSTLTCKLDASRKNKELVMIISLAVATGIISTTASTLCLLRRKMKRRVKCKKLLDISPHHYGGSFRTNELLELANVNDNIDVPSVDFECILEATNNFSDSNRLGRGGFGPVYKGKLPGGQLIAIKRLSKSSGQGLEEFRNELLLIAKLQHRNLVRMLGYCIEEKEKMLIYEYMPNKSLDFFLFNPNQRILLDWNKRFNIILGITRGLLYLHQDSRLRIIHRDLKTSNILLDKDMNPKISDFGMARIFGGDQAEENTKRVVGTYGYMAPEYAADGLFSVKSDVFSFGIILLEIVSGRKNTGFYSEENGSLAGHAWQLWKEERGLNLADPSLHDSKNPTQVLRCIHLALLCIQENAVDRPTIASELIALESEVASLQTPKQPAFFGGTCPTTIRNSSSSSSQMPIFSNNEITISALEGR